MKKIIAMMLIIVMTVTLCAFPVPAFAAEEADSASELFLFACNDKAEVTKKIPKASADSKKVKNNKYSACWDMGFTDNISLKEIPSSFSGYSECKMIVYANTNTTAFAYFISDNTNTDGMDYYGQLLEFERGWNEISINLSEMAKTRDPNWGKVASLEFSCTGWNQTKDTSAIIYIDSISLVKNDKYEMISVPTPKPTPTPLPDGEAGIVRYYATDFEDVEEIGAPYQKDNKISIEESKDGNRFMQIKKTGVQDAHYDRGIKNATRYVIISADFATTKLAKATSQFITCKSANGQHTFVSLFENGEVKAGSEVVAKIKPDGKFINVAVAGDFANNTYSVYIDGKMVLEDKYIGKEFGVPTSLRIYMGAGEDNGANLMVDNIKIYDGITPEDFENTVDAAVAAEKLFATMTGKQSPIIDYGASALMQIEQASGVVLNVHSGYIHANSKRYMPDAAAYIKNGRTLLPVRAISEALGCKVEWDEQTRTVTIDGSAKIVIDSTEMILPDGSVYTLDVPAEITNDRTFIPLRALCEKVLGKTVFWNDRGLIVLTDEEITLSESDISSLNNYMLYTRPSANEIKELFEAQNKNTHPRVILNQSRFDEIISDAKTDEYVKKWSERVIASADKYLGKEHESYVIPDGLRLLETSRAVKEKARVLAMAFKLTGNREYVDYLWEEIQAAGNFPDWNHKLHYLDVGEMAFGFAIAYDWLYDCWTDEQKKFMEECIYKHALVWTQKALYGQADYPHFFVTDNTNWNAVCNGGVGVAAIAVFDKYPDICADILEKNMVSLEVMMKDFYPHGAWYEGASYWNYLMQYLSYFVSTLDTAFNTDFNISKAPGFSSTGEYYLASDGMTGCNNFHDAGVSHLQSNYLFWLSRKLNQPDLTKVNLYKMEKYGVAGGGVDGIIYYDPSVGSATQINMPLDSYFGNTEIVSLRSSWVNDGGVYASFHSGKNNVNHAHLDGGSFVVDFGGQRFAGDIGAEDYNIDGYWGAKRYKYYRTRPEGHNVFVINPDSSNGQDLSGKEVFSKFETKPRGGYAVTPLDSMYKSYADSAARGIMLGDDRRSVLIRDEIRGMKKDVNQVYWFMQMESVDVQVIDKNTAILTKFGIPVKLQVLSDADDCQITVTDPVVLPTSENLPNQTENKNWKRLAIIFTSGKDLNINVKMSLLGDPLGDSPIEDIPLDSWSIPDGEIPDFPKLKGINVAGNAIEDFDDISTFYTHILPYGATEVPAVEAVCGENATATVALPQSLPGNAVITVTDKNDERLQTSYTVLLRAAKEIEIEVSAAQEGNPGEQCLDGNLDTRWAVEGESWGIFSFYEPKTISSVWIATWKAAERQMIFDIEVSTDGENFTQAWSGRTSAVSDVLEEIKIPEGTYKAVKLVLHGTTTGTWNSILEVDFK